MDRKKNRGGFLTNYLSLKFEDVLGDAYNLPYEDNSCDVVCAMDFLEHVEGPEKVVTECSRILKDNGISSFIPLIEIP